MPSPVYRGGPTDNPAGFEPQAVGNYPAKSDVADQDNIYLSDQGWVYRHFKNLDKTEYWDEIIWAGDVTDPPQANDPVNTFGAANVVFNVGDGIQAVSGPYPKSSSAIGTAIISGPDQGDKATNLAYTVAIDGALTSGDTWKWEVLSGPGAGTISNATGNFTGNTPAQANTNISFAATGSYQIKVTLTDTSTGETTTDTFGVGVEDNVVADTIGTVSVSGQDHPQAGIGVTYTAAHDGTAPQGDLTYTWTATPSSGVTVDPTVGNVDQAKFVFTTQASIQSTVVKCVVTDGSASDSPQEGTLTAVPHFVIGTPVISGPTTSTAGQASTNFTVASYTDQSNPAPNDLTYQWTASPSGGVTFSAATAATTTVTVASAGSPTITCVVSSAKSDPSSSPVSNSIVLTAS